MRVNPTIGRATKLALDHPWLVALGSAVLMGCWVGGMLRGTLREAVEANKRIELGIADAVTSALMPDSRHWRCRFRSGIMRCQAALSTPLA